jgi:glycosyltransferase involved in cell wall biosynthesis
MRGDSITGPGVYAMRVLDRMVATTAFEWFVYCSEDVSLPAHLQARASVRELRFGARRVVRVAFEQLVLPVLTRRDRIDLLFSPAFVSPAWGAPNLVATIHDMYYEVVPDVLPPWQRRYWKMFVPVTARRCKRLLAVSDSTARDIAKYLPAARDKIRVTPLASAVQDVDTPGEAIPGLESGFVLFVANVVANKNPEVVVRAARLLEQKGQAQRFVHVGRDDHGLMAAALAASDAAASFRRLGTISAAQLRWVYQNAVCAVQPSIYEGFGIPVLEAQAFGVPLICSDAGPLPQVAGDAALFFSPTDASKLASLISSLVSDADLRSRLAENGRRNAARFTWEATAEATLAAFRELLPRVDR